MKCQVSLRYRWSSLYEAHLNFVFSGNENGKPCEEDSPRRRLVEAYLWGWQRQRIRQWFQCWRGSGTGAWTSNFWRWIEVSDRWIPIRSWACVGCLELAPVYFSFRLDSPVASLTSLISMKQTVLICVWTSEKRWFLWKFKFGSTTVHISLFVISGRHATSTLCLFSSTPRIDQLFSCCLYVLTIPAKQIAGRCQWIMIYCVPFESLRCRSFVCHYIQNLILQFCKKCEWTANKYFQLIERKFLRFVITFQCVCSASEKCRLDSLTGWKL